MSDKRWSAEDKERIRKRWESGDSGGKIGEEFGVSRNCIIGLAHRNGWRQSGTGERLPAYQFQKPQSKPKKEIPMQPVSEQPSAPALAPIIADLSPMVAIPETRRVRLVNLKENHCRWPIGDGPDLVFCGGERLTTKRGSMREPYCAHHRQLSIAKAGKPQSEEANMKRRLAMLKVGTDAFAPARAKKAAKAS